MEVEEDQNVPDCLPTAEFLSAEELVNLRKPVEETPQPAIGEKFYRCTDSLSEEEAVKCALEGFKESLNKKRAGRISELMQAEWNPETNIVTVSKLKGKFTQHMGRLVNGKYILAPEEAVFLLENNCIEIMNNKMPMSTEEAFSLILKGSLAHEKYQVYSHLSKLGYVVVVHQIKQGMAECEKEMRKYILNKKRHLKEHVGGEPQKKRLTFTGAFSEESEIKTTSDTSEENSKSLKKTRICEANEHEGTEDSMKNVHSDAEEQSGSGVVTDKVIEDIQSDLDKINQGLLNTNESEARLETESFESSNKKSPVSDKFAEENENIADTEKNINSNGENTQNLNDSAENNKLQKDLPSKNVDNKDYLDSNSQSSKIVDVMDVDMDAEASCNTSEVSRDHFTTFDSTVNATSQDSCISVNNDDTTEGGANGDSNLDVLSMSCSSIDEEEVLTLDAESADNNLREHDDDITLLEVTKKETKPLAVIDLLSDDDDDESEIVNVDDDITVLEEYPSPSTANRTPSKEVNLNKIKGYKNEAESSRVSNSKLIPPLKVQFPDLFKKSVVCVARPPSHLLPHNVRPAKEAYVLNLKSKNSAQPSHGCRVWNSYRDLQDYQQQRRQNRHQNNIPTGQVFPALPQWNDRNSRNRDRFRRTGFGSDRVHSPDLSSNSRNLFVPPPVDFNRNLLPTNSFQNNAPIPNHATTNREVSIKEDISENMVSSNSQLSHSNNFNFSSGIQNNPLINPLVPNSNFIPGVQRNAFSSMGNVSNQLMAELHRTCFTVASNMLSSMLNRNSSLLPSPSLPMFSSGLNSPGSFNPNVSNGFNNSFNPPVSNEYFSVPHQNFGDQQRRFNRGRPFPCSYRNIQNKRSWSDVRSAVCPSNSNSDSDVEEMPISPREILWDNNDICPLVKPGVCYPVGSVFKFLQITQKAKVTYKFGYSEKLLSGVSNLEISFDVYTPGFAYKKSNPQVPKYRIVVVRSTDPFPKYSDVAILQREWSDEASLLIAVNDNGDISFQSFNSISLPLLTPHKD